jgi:protoporphyrinogen oxidase
MSLPHVTVLGAGVCGLAAAWELLRSGTAARVTVLEAESRPGGMARSVFDPSGLKSDLGPHRIHTVLPEIDALLGDLVAEEMIWVNRRSAMYVEGRFVHYPLSLGTVLKLYGPLELGLMAASAASAKIGGLFRGEAKNFAEFMSRAFGPRLYHRILEPYSAKVWKLPPEEISVEAAKVRVSAGSMGKLARRILSGGREKPGQETALRRFRYVKGGVEAIVHRLCQKVKEAGGVILCDSPATGLRLEQDTHWWIQHAGGEIESSAVISTIPIPTLVHMLSGEGHTRPPEEDLAQLEYLAIFLVFVVVRRPAVSENHWLYFPDADICFNRGYESKQFYADGGTPSDETILCLEITARPGSALDRESDDQLIADVIRDLAKTRLVQPAEVGKSFVVRLPFGYPLYHQRVDSHLRRVFDGLRGWPHLVTTGRQGLFSHNNMDHSMHMGLEAARALAHAPEGVARWYDNVDRLRHFRIVD